MPTKLDLLRAELAELHFRIADELAAGETALRGRLTRGRAAFDAETRAAHRAARESLASFLANIRPLHVLTAPLIYSLILPFAALDLFVTVFQALCFPVYHIEKVRRADHILIDRQFLAYLNPLQKLNCIYCSYCNGLISYVREIAARTEAYWCPIKHSQRMKGTHPLHETFVPYGDAAAYRARLDEQRAEGKQSKA